MALTTYPLNNTDYSAEDAELFHCTRSSGIYAGEDFQPAVTGADRSITIGPGLGWIRNGRFSGKVIAQKESATLDMGLSDAAYPRIDAVVIRFSSLDNQTALVVKHGTAASSPVPPVLEQTEAVYELHLCHVRRPAGSAVVSVADVTDLRTSPQYCGLMADSVSKIDTERIDAQVAALVKRLDAAIAQTQGSAGFVSKTRLWKNDKFTGSGVEEFPYQRIDIPCENYDGIEIILYEDNMTDALRSTGVLPLVTGTRIVQERVGYPGTYSKRRTFDINPDYISVGDGWHFESGSTAMDNCALVPVEIYGYTGTIDPNAETPPAVRYPNKPLLLAEEDAEAYLEDSTVGDAALEAIKAGRQILVKVPNADGGSYTANYSPVYMHQLPNLENEYLYLFYLKDEKQDLSALLGQPAGTVLMPTYGQLKMLLSQEYNEDPLVAIM